MQLDFVPAILEKIIVLSCILNLVKITWGNSCYPLNDILELVSALDNIHPPQVFLKISVGEFSSSFTIFKVLIECQFHILWSPICIMACLPLYLPSVTNKKMNYYFKTVAPENSAVLFAHTH